MRIWSFLQSTIISTVVSQQQRRWTTTIDKEMVTLQATTYAQQIYYKTQMTMNVQLWQREERKGIRTENDETDTEKPRLNYVHGQRTGLQISTKILITGF